MNKLIENREGYLWPKSDTKCWNYMLTHSDLPVKISKLIKEKNVVVQAGGNAGYYVKEYSKIFNWVYTFEPEPLNFYCLTHNADSQNVFKYQACLGDTRNLVDLNIKEGNRGKNYIKGSGKIPTMMIDDLGLNECNLIHLDIEGYELFALKGAKKTLEKCRPVIVIEYFEKCATRFNYTLNDVEQFMSSSGYKLETTFDEERVYFPI